MFLFVVVVAAGRRDMYKGYIVAEDDALPRRKKKEERPAWERRKCRF